MTVAVIYCFINDSLGNKEPVYENKPWKEQEKRNKFVSSDVSWLLNVALQIVKKSENTFYKD